MAKTVHSDGNPQTGEMGSIVTAGFLNALNNPVFDGEDEDGHFLPPPVAYARATVTASTAISAATHCIIFADATSGEVVLTAADSAAIYHIKKTDISANSVVFSPAGGKTVDGEVTLELTVQGERTTIVRDATGNWQSIS